MSVGQDGRSSLYLVLGVEWNSSAAEIRAAYRKLAMQWHPDKCRGLERAKADLAKKKFQEIQEAYEVLSNNGKRTLSDVGLYDPADSDEEIRGLYDFFREISSMMPDVRSQKQEPNETFQDLQQIFLDTFRADLEMWGLASPSLQATHPGKKRSCEASVQCRHVSANVQKRSSELAPGPRNGLPMNSSLSELKKLRRSSSKTISDLSPQSSDTYCHLRCYGGSSFNSGTAFV